MEIPMLKVFIADDSVVVRGRLKELLEEQGSIKVVGESGNAEQAITEINRLDPDVVILDIRMPGGGGLPVLKDIKAREPSREVIIFTSFPYQQYRDAYLAAGANYFFDKSKDVQKMTDLLVKLASDSGEST
jgi:DNA-binding NarL/FixJ family response regulator